MQRRAWRLMMAAATLMASAGGGRAAFDLFVSPVRVGAGHLVSGAVLQAACTALPNAWPPPSVVALAQVASAVSYGAAESSGVLLR